MSVDVWSKYKLVKIENQRSADTKVENVKKVFVKFCEEQIGYAKSMNSHPDRENRKNKKHAFGKRLEGGFYAKLKYGRRSVDFGDGGDGAFLPDLGAVQEFYEDWADAVRKNDQKLVTALLDISSNKKSAKAEDRATSSEEAKTEAAGSSASKTGASTHPKGRS